MEDIFYRLDCLSKEKLMSKDVIGNDIGQLDMGGPLVAKMGLHNCNLFTLLLSCCALHLSFQDGFLTTFLSQQPQNIVIPKVQSLLLLLLVV